MLTSQQLDQLITKKIELYAKQLNNNNSFQKIPNQRNSISNHHSSCQRKYQQKKKRRPIFDHASTKKRKVENMNEKYLPQFGELSNYEKKSSLESGILTPGELTQMVNKLRLKQRESMKNHCSLSMAPI